MIANVDDPCYEDKIIRHIIRLIIEDEEKESILQDILETFEVSRSSAQTYLRKAKRTIKYYKSSDLELCIKLHAKRYSDIERYSHKMGIVSVRLRAMRAYNSLLSMEGGDFALVVQGGIVRTLDRNRIEMASDSSSDDTFSHLSQKDKLWLRDVLAEIKR